MVETIKKKTIVFIILRQFAYLILFIVMFVFANVLTIISLFCSFFKQPLNYNELQEIYNKNFKILKGLL